MAGRIYETAIKIGAKVDASLRSETLAAAAAIGKVEKATEKLAAAQKAIAGASPLTRLAVQADKLAAASKAAESFSRLSVATQAAAAKYNTASEALARLGAAEMSAGGATKESTKWRKAGEAAVKAAEKEYQRATKATTAGAAALRAAGVDTSKLTTEQQRLAASLVATERAMSLATRADERMARAEGLRTRLVGARKDGFLGLFEKNKASTAAKLGASLGTARDRIGSIVGDVAKLAGIGTAAGAALAGLAMKSLKAGDEIGDTADRLGIGSTALQELRYGAQQSGAETGELDKALGKLAINLGKVNAAKKKGGGGGGFVGNAGEVTMFADPTSKKAGPADPFKALGLNAKELAQLKPEQQIAKIADGMAKLKTHSEKSAAAVAIFGKGGQALIPMLAEGSAGVARMSAAGHKFGGIMSVEAVEAADRADKALKNAEAAAAGVANTLGSALLPTAVRVFESFSGWVTDNREKIKLWAEKVASWIEKKAIPALLKIGPRIWDIAVKVGALIDRGAKLAGGFGNLAIAMAALRLAPLASSLAQVGWQLGQGIVGLVRYTAAKWSAVAATKALNAAEGASGGGVLPGVNPSLTGKAIGGAASATMVLAAAAIGWEIGTAIDKKLGISDKAGGKIKENADGTLNKGGGQDWWLRGAASTLAPITFGASSVAAEHFIGQRNRAIEATNGLGAVHAAKLEHVKALQKDQGISFEAASAAVFRNVAPAVPALSSPNVAAALRAPQTGKVLKLEHKISVQGSASRDEIEAAMKAATPEMLEQVRALLAADRDEQRRVSFG